MGCTQSAVSKLYRHCVQTGLVDDRPRSGQPLETTQHQDRYIRLTHLKIRFLPTSKIATTTNGTHHRVICGDTIRRWLHESGLTARCPFVGPILNQQIRERRLDRARHRRRWTFQRCGTVLFTDESRFCISIAHGRRRPWKRREERTARCCVLEHYRWGGRGVMV